MGDIVTFRQSHGLERTWVPRDQEAQWIAFFGRGGIPAARWKDYLRWGRSFYPPTDSAERITLRPQPRRGRSRARSRGY